MFSWLVVASLPLLYLIWSLVAMEMKYRKASASLGVPLVRVPVDPLNPLWMIFGPIVWQVLDLFPFDYDSFKHSKRGWFFFDKSKTFQQLGPIWGIVTPKDVYLHLADPEATQRIFARRLDYIRPSWLYSVLDIYGPCISTSSPTDWPRHRKVVASPFNESIMNLVWTETINKSRDLIQQWETSCVAYSKDIRDLSLAVLAATGFRRHFDFEDATADDSKQGNSQGYQNALQLVLDNAIWLLVFPYQRLASPWLPRSWRELGEAGIEFKRYMEIMLDQAFQAEDRGDSDAGSLIGSFVKAIDSSSGKSLNMDEIFGNIFVINFAGHDTTANTFAFMILLLALHPEVQEWVAEEIRHVFPETTSEWSYSDFARLKRCHAVLLETLRLYPPNPQIPKWTNDHPQTLNVAGEDITIPPRTGIMLCPLAIQTLPEHWLDPLKWQPQRWITTPVTSAGSQEESIIEPKPGTYFPWSAGPQNCPGEKFSKVEAIATISSFLRQYRVRIVAKAGESVTQAAERTQRVLEECDLTLLVRMKNANSVKLQWIKM